VALPGAVVRVAFAAAAAMIGNWAEVALPDGIIRGVGREGEGVAGGGFVERDVVENGDTGGIGSEGGIAAEVAAELVYCDRYCSVGDGCAVGGDGDARIGGARRLGGDDRGAGAGLDRLGVDGDRERTIDGAVRGDDLLGGVDTGDGDVTRSRADRRGRVDAGVDQGIHGPARWGQREGG